MWTHFNYFNNGHNINWLFNDHHFNRFFHNHKLVLWMMRMFNINWWLLYDQNFMDGMPMFRFMRLNRLVWRRQYSYLEVLKRTFSWRVSLNACKLEQKPVCSTAVSTFGPSTTIMFTGFALIMIVLPLLSLAFVGSGSSIEEHVEQWLESSSSSSLRKSIEKIKQSSIFLPTYK